MKKLLILVITILIVFFLLFSIIPLDIIYSIIPGWNTEIIPFYYIVLFVLIVNFFFPLLFYWLINRENKKIKIYVIYLHMFLSSLIILFFKIPGLFNNSIEYDLNQSVIESLIVRVRSVFLLFIFEQILFVLYLLFKIKPRDKNVL